jgi:hypothetical protein
MFSHGVRLSSIAAIVQTKFTLHRLAKCACNSQHRGLLTSFFLTLTTLLIGGWRLFAKTQIFLQKYK